MLWSPAGPRPVPESGIREQEENVILNLELNQFKQLEQFHTVALEKGPEVGQGAAGFHHTPFSSVLFFFSPRWQMFLHICYLRDISMH